MTARDSYLLLRAFVDELVRCGVRHACTSPGSRCAPIVLSLARDRRLRTWSHIDERSSGFFALGVGKASGTPAVVTCTSGTAAGNLLPAVIECSEARVPMIVLTADRPPELRGVGAGQTIDQIKLYGDAAKWFFELGVHDATPERLRWIRALACRAFWTATDAPCGAVHLNVPLREPLVLQEPLGGDPGDGGRADGAPWVSVERSGNTADASASPAARAAGADRVDRPLIVAGAISPDPQVGRRLSELAGKAAVPLLADPLSGARGGSAAVAHYDLILREPELARTLAPSVVWRVGELPTSKPLRAWLATVQAPQLAYAVDGAWSDPDSMVARRTVAQPSGLLEALEQALSPAHDAEWLRRWASADAVVASAISAALDPEELSEPQVAAALAEALPQGATLFVASSMPIRDLETYMPAASVPPRTLSNRGANGIDGTVSSAYGVAAAGPGPVVLLTGDVALAHDIGGLMASRRERLGLTIVLLNNDGGGIFHFLPIAGERDAFEQHVATPHGLSFAHVADTFGCRFHEVTSRTALLDAVRAALGLSETTIIEVRTDRAANLELHRRVEQDARDRLRGLLKS
jgi:2-succinyl-5-enolpyruvyl-6-hydroxy-3-cyclohexene-1-carboxylate synthase